MVNVTSSVTVGSSSKATASVRGSGCGGGTGSMEGLACGGYDCFYCLTPCAEFRRGWKLRCGKYAALCFTCSSAYEDGSFCKIFHWMSNGWRHCSTCEKSIHCGCIMAAHTYEMLDAGGIQCMNCVKTEHSKRSKNQNAISSSQATQNASKSN